MSMLEKITTGKIMKPAFMAIYGPSGIGKTTFGASAPKPLFLATEEGTNELDVARLQVASWGEMKGALSELLETQTAYESLVVDSLDHLESLIFQQVAKDHGKASVEEIGYAKGYIYALEYWGEFIRTLKAIRDTHKKHIILISHAHVKTFTDPHHNEAYDRFELKMHKKASELIKESVDTLLFARKDVSFKKDKNSNKTQVFDMNERLLYTELEAAFDAKNRFGLPQKIKFPASGAFQILLDAMETSHGETPEAVIRQIKELTKRIDDKETCEKALAYAEENKTNLPALRKTMERLQQIIKE